MTPSPSLLQPTPSKGESWDDLFSTSISSSGTVQQQQHAEPDRDDFTADAQAAESGYSTTDDEFTNAGADDGIEDDTNPNSQGLNNIELENDGSVDHSPMRKSRTFAEHLHFSVDQYEPLLMFCNSN